jgi:hypothetical protein
MSSKKPSEEDILSTLTIQPIGGNIDQLRDLFKLYELELNYSELEHPTGELYLYMKFDEKKVRLPNLIAYIDSISKASNRKNIDYYCLVIKHQQSNLFEFNFLLRSCIRL